jgi:hypothetical protein
MHEMLFVTLFLFLFYYEHNMMVDDKIKSKEGDKELHEVHAYLFVVRWQGEVGRGCMLGGECERVPYSEIHKLLQKTSTV